MGSADLRAWRPRHPRRHHPRRSLARVGWTYLEPTRTRSGTLPSPRAPRGSSSTPRAWHAQVPTHPSRRLHSSSERRSKRSQCQADLAHVTKMHDARYPYGSVYWHNVPRVSWSFMPRPASDCSSAARPTTTRSPGPRRLPSPTPSECSAMSTSGPRSSRWKTRWPRSCRTPSRARPARKSPLLSTMDLRRTSTRPPNRSAGHSPAD